MLTYVNIYLAVILENQIQLMQNQNITVRDQMRTQEQHQSTVYTALLLQGCTGRLSRTCWEAGTGQVRPQVKSNHSLFI